MQIVFTQDFFGTNVGRWHALDHNNHPVNSTVARTRQGADALRNQIERGDEGRHLPWTPDEWKALTGH